MEPLARKKQKKDRLDKMKIAEVIGESWFYFSFFFILLFPVIDSIRKIKTPATEPQVAIPSWSHIFQSNLVLALLSASPVFLAYGYDFIFHAKKADRWNDGKKKRRRLLILAAIILLYCILWLFFSLLNM